MVILDYLYWPKLTFCIPLAWSGQILPGHQILDI